MPVPIKKKPFFDFKNPVAWGSIIVAGGIIFTTMGKFVDFMRVTDAVAAESKRIDKLEESTKQIADVLKEQQVINNYIHEQELKHKEQTLSPDGKFYLDEDTQKWKKVKHD